MPPPGIPDKQWRGKSDLDKMRDKYRERNMREASHRVADSSNCIPVHDDGEVNSDGEDVNTMIERIKVQSITMADMSNDEILAMNDELYQLSDRASDPFSGRSRRRRDGLYFDHMGRRRYRSPERDSRDSRDGRDSRNNRDGRDSREGRDRDYSRRGHDDRRTDSRSGSDRYSRDQYDKHRYQSDYKKDGSVRWVSALFDFKLEYKISNNRDQTIPISIQNVIAYPTGIL